MIAASYATLGQGDWQTRLPTALFSVGSSALLYALLKRAGRPRAGIFAALLHATIPFTIYFGGQPELMNPQLVFFYLATTLAFFELLDRPDWKTLLLLCAAFACLGATDWPGFYFVPVACAMFVLRPLAIEQGQDGRGTRPPFVRNVIHRLFRPGWQWLFAFGLWSIAVFVLLNAQVVFAADQPWNWIVSRVASRGAGVGATDDFTWSNWWKYAWIYNYDNHGVPLMLLALAWVVLFALRRFPRDRAADATILLLFVGLLNVVIGRQGCYAHPWWWWPVTPGLVLAAALVLDRIYDRALSRFSPRAVATTFTVTLVAYAAWNLYTTIPGLLTMQEQWGGSMSPSRSLAAAVRAAAPSMNDTVIIMAGDTHPTLWYVADRPMKLHVWDLDAFHARMTDDIADLPFGFMQQWKQKPVAAVIPRSFENISPRLLQHLREIYSPLAGPEEVLRDYHLFDLRPATNPPR